MSLDPSAQPAPLVCRIDHLVVAADNLDQGAQWCADTFGVSPLSGGRHLLMATHNLLLKMAAPDWPEAYLEIIAIDPLAEQPPAAGRSRWFGLDDPMQRRLIKQAPRLVHAVARSSDLARACVELAGQGEHVGEIVSASRQTAEGELRWRITVRADGIPQHHGALPTLIEWQGRHPASSMTDGGVRLCSLTARSERPLELQRAWSAIGLDQVVLEPGASKPPLEAVLSSPRGEVRLSGGFGFA